MALFQPVTAGSDAGVPGTRTTGHHRARRKWGRGPRRAVQTWPSTARTVASSDDHFRSAADDLLVARGDATSYRIGITGHCDLTASSLPLLTAALREWLAPLNGRKWVGVSCLARGADQLFASLVLELGGRLEVILPAHDYRSRKVEPDNAAQFDRLLATATTVAVMDFERSCRDAYMSASTALLGAVDTMVAVWDGQPAQRHGSTGDVVIAARQLGLPVTVLWPLGAARHSPAPTGTGARADPGARPVRS